ncbi:MAG: dihydrofolate reductase family protein [Candidatus Pacebacteria bacterium]|nr:dihydrofolate reductase family protein [Candidatus Paceibacterota bacterium]
MINASIIVATSKDGFIARARDVDPSTAWTSREDKKRFVELSKRIGTLILGLNTFETFPRDEHGNVKPLKGRHHIVYADRDIPIGPDVEATMDKPDVLLKKLSDRGVKEAAVVGGASIYRMFLDADLVDTIYMTVEPVEFGTGLPFFNGNLEERFKLVKEENVGNGTIFKEYKRR